MMNARKVLNGVLVLVMVLAGLLLNGDAAARVQAQGKLIFVNANASLNGDGTTWGTAYKYLQDALTAAESGDEIWVARGVYTPGLTVDSTFQLKSGVALYGGFATTTETLRAQRDWTANVTVLSGDIDGNDAADANGVVTSSGNIVGSNAYHVVTSSEVTETAILDGFTVTAGQAIDGSDCPLACGGGMFNESSSPTLTNVTFSGNSAGYGGGGMFNESSSPTLTNVTFSGNSAGEVGGGMFNRSSSPMLTNVTFSGNSATYGGGMNNDSSSSPTLSNSILWGDSPLEIINHDDSTAIITYSDVQGGWPGVGNIDADPQFILPGANGDYHLSPCSPAIDAGNTAAVNTDLGGNPRVQGRAVDMGAYESAPATAACLWVNLSVTPPATEPGQPVTYVLTFGNAATANAITATNVVITNITPTEITMPGVVAHSGALITATPGVSFAWQVADLAPGNTGIITLSGVLSVALSQPVSVVSTATIASVPADGYPTDNVSVAVLRAPVVLYVNRNAPSPQHDGLSWTTAYTGVQTALAAAGNGNEIWVARGVYTPGLTMSSTFELKNGVALYGGFAATETLRAQRDSAANDTVLSGDVDGNDNADANGVVANPGNIVGSNAYHVVMGSRVDETAVLDGFTVTAGRADDESDCPSGCGGGMFNYSGSPTLNHLAFSGNSANYGGGVFNSHLSNPALHNIILSGNSATVGGGIYNYSSSPTLNNVTLSGNSAVIGGGMINAYSSNPILNNVTFSGNSASYSNGGGGMLSAYSSGPTLNNSILWGDSPNEIVNWDTSTATITYSDVAGGYAGTGNLNAAPPLFVDAANGDLRLQAGSPAIDAGHNLSVTAATDLDGNPRIVNGVVDMGAYENQGALIHLAKTVSSRTAQPGDTLTYTLALSATDGIAIATLTDTLPVGLTYVPGSVTGGATYTSGQICYTGPVASDSIVTITYRAQVNADVPPGSLLVNTAVVTGAGRLEESSVAVAVPNDGFNKTLFLLYLGGDGNLADAMLDLLNAAETEADNSNAVIWAVLDGPGANDSYLYRLQHDHNLACPNYSNPICNGLYAPGQNLWPWPEDTGSPYSLAEFLTSAELAYPNAAQVLVRIAGHGEGWTAAISGVQPRSHGTQPGGFLWDDHPGSSFNTQELSDAFAWAKQATGRAVNLLYLDACLMGAAPVADALSDNVGILLVSESLEWTEATPIDQDIAAIDGSHTAQQLGEHWLRNGADFLTSGNYPHTYSLISATQMTGVRAAENNLAAALSAALPASRDQISATWTSAGCFDSSGSSRIGPEDNLCDLSVWAGEIAAQFSVNPTIVSAAQALQDAVSAAVITETHHNGDFIYSSPKQTWAWGALGGLSDYLPLRTDNWQRPYYSNGPWRDFLNAYWANATPPEPPLPCTTDDCAPPDPPARNALQIGDKNIESHQTVYVPITAAVQDVNGVASLQFGITASQPGIIIPAANLTPRLGGFFPAGSYTYTVATAGGWEAILSLPAGSNPISGTGVVLEVPFITQSEGCVDLDFTQHLMVNGAARNITHNAIPGRVCVSDKGAFAGTVALESRSAGILADTQIVAAGPRGVYTTTTDANGNFSLTDVYSDVYTVAFRHTLFVTALRAFNVTARLTTEVAVGLWAGDLDDNGQIETRDWYLCAAASIPVNDPAFDINADGATNAIDCTLVWRNIGRANMPGTNPPAGRAQAQAEVTTQSMLRLYTSTAGLVLIPRANGELVVQIKGVRGLLQAAGTRLTLPAGAEVASASLQGKFAGGFLRWHQAGAALYIVAAPAEGATITNDTDLVYIQLRQGEAADIKVDAFNAVGTAQQHQIFLPVMMR